MSKNTKERNGMETLEILVFESKTRHEQVHLAKVEKNRLARHIGEFRRILSQRDGNYCACCGEQKELTIDHIIPLSLGGKTRFSNLQLLCRTCNEAKADQIIDYRGVTS